MCHLLAYICSRHVLCATRAWLGAALSEPANHNADPNGYSGTTERDKRHDILPFLLLGVEMAEPFPIEAMHTFNRTS